MTRSLRGAGRRSVRWLRSAIFVLPALAAQPLAAQESGHEEGIVELIADRLPPLTVIVLVDSAGSLLLPVEQVLDYLGLASPRSDRTIVVPQTGGGSARLDTIAFRMIMPARTIALTPAELARRGDVVYLRTGHLATLLEAEINVNLATLSVSFLRAIPFAAQQRIVAEQRRTMILARQRWLEQREAIADVPYRPLTGGVIADWEIFTNSLDPTRLTTLRAHTGVALLGGDLGGSGALELGSDATQSLRDLSLQYHRVFPRSAWLTQLRGGNVLTSGLFGRYVRGAEVSNRPFLRSEELSSILVNPDLPPGWEFEVFQGNQLLGYSEVGLTDAVAVRLRAGTTPLYVRMIGPAGEEVVRTLVYQTPVSMLRNGAVEYVTGGGACSAVCDEYVHGDVRYGVSSLFTAGGGAELLTDSAGTHFNPYFIYSFTTGTRLTAEIAFMPLALYSANLAAYPREGTTAYLRGSLSRQGLGPISLLGDERMRWDGELTVDERIEQKLPFSHVRLGFAASGLTGVVQRWRTSATAAFNRGYLEMRYDRDRVVRPHLVSARTALFTPVSVRGRTFRPLLGGMLGVDGSGVRLGELNASLQPASGTMISAGLQWQRGSSQPTVALGYSTRTGPLLAALRAVSTESGRSSSLMLSGSAAASYDGSITLHPSARTGYAGLSGLVFSDNDGDGVFSAGDEPVPDMHLVVGGFPVTADAHGRFRAWGLQPYQPVTVAVDSTRNTDPAWTMLRDVQYVRPVPNMARSVDVPLVRTRELIGSVIAPDDDVIIGSLTLEITNVDTGDVTTTTTFTDGFFYVARLRPGSYRLAVSAASLNAVGGVSDPAALSFMVPTGGDAPVELEPLGMRRSR